MDYIPRIIDDYLAHAVASLPAITFDGCKGVGKTETATRLAASRIDLDNEVEVEALREDPDRILRLPHPLLIDEWQLYPAIWDRVRRAVDAAPSPGRFILTGSATPNDPPKHSGAGRIVHFRMRPFSLAERGLARPTIILADMLAGEVPDIAGACNVGVDAYSAEIVRGGLPALRTVPPDLRRVAWDAYLSEVLDRDLPELGRKVRRRQTLRAWLRSYALATASTATYTSILDNATPNDSDKPSRITTSAWGALLERMWLLDPLPAWDNPLHALSRLAGMTKHHLADPALAAHLLGVTASTLLTQGTAGQPLPRPGTLFGALFESLVTLSLRVYAEPLGATVSHLRTKNGDHEVDLMVTRPDGRCVAFEVKSTAQVGNAEVQHLRWLQAQLGPDLLDCAVINTGPAAYRRQSDNIAVIPAVLLR